MGLEQVINDVRRAGETRAKAILSDAQTQANGIIAVANDKADAYTAERTSQADRTAQQVEAQVLSNAQFEARKMVLTVEAELRDTLRDAIIAGFAKLPAKTRQAHLKTLLATATEVLGAGKVSGSSEDAEFLKKQAGFEYGKNVDIAGGLIAESKDGKTRLDLSYETLLHEMWRDVLKQEAGLF